MFASSFHLYRRSVLLALLLALCVSFFPASAPAQQVVGWGSNQFGQLNVPAAANGISSIAVGSRHVLALKSDGTVVAWGTNDYGQCNVPAGLTGVKQIAAGGRHSMALLSNGSVVVWGSNNFGQLNIPGGLTGVKQVSAGFAFCVALTYSGQVVAWGDNTKGQTNVPALSEVVQISAGNSHVLALKADRTVAAWGRTTEGQCNVPKNLTNVLSVSAGFYHSLATAFIQGVSKPIAWGRNVSGQCEIPTGIGSSAQVAGGNEHTLLLLQNGIVVGWGANDSAQSTPPLGLTGIVQVAAGENCSFALNGFRFALNRQELYAGESATGVVTLFAPAGPGGIEVELSSYASEYEYYGVTVPRTLTIPQGETRGTFPVSTKMTFLGYPGSYVRASFRGITIEAPLSVIPEKAMLSVSTPTLVGGSTAKQTLTAKLLWAPLNSVTIRLVTAEDNGVTVPAAVTFSAGETTRTVTIAHQAVPDRRTISVFATYGYYHSESGKFDLLPIVGTLSFIPMVLEGGNDSLGVVQLNAAPAKSMTVPLTSNNPNLVTVPTSVAIKAGEKAVAFAVGTKAVTAVAFVPVTAQIVGQPVSDELQLLPAPALLSLTVPTSAYGNQIVTGRVKLRTASAGGTRVTLTVGDRFSVPSVVTVPAGSTEASFPITVLDRSGTGTSVLSATAGGVQLSKQIEAREVTLASITFLSTTVLGGRNVEGTVSLRHTVQIPTQVLLYSDNPLVRVPATVTIPAGANSVKFTATTLRTSVITNAKVIAAKNDISVYRTLKITP